MSSLTKLFDHLAWADERVCRGLRTSPGADPRALEIYAHIVGVEHVWLTRLRQEPARHAVWPEYSLDQCEPLGAENAAAFRSMVAALTPEERRREIPYRNSARQSYSSSVGDILLHVALHGAYHRGQVALLVRGGGGEPAPTDYIAMARDAPAATRVRSSNNG